MSIVPIHEDSFWTVSIDAPNRLVRVKRSANPFTTLGDAEASFTGLRRVLATHPLVSYRLLMDSRDGPGRNDPEFEEITRRFRGELLGSFTKAVMLLRTVVGRMQMERLQREAGAPFAELFSDEAEALRSLGIPPG